jgi:Skp family chaperone for outer membrane proteins
VAGCLYVGETRAFAAEKTGYVVLATLFDQYEKTQDADEKLSETAAQKQTERDKMVENIRRMKDELVVLSDEGEEKLKKQAEIDEKIKELQAFDEETRKELREIRDANVKEIFDDLKASIEEYGEKNKYDLIFTDRALVYQNEKLDITDAVLKDVNKKYKK